MLPASTGFMASHSAVRFLSVFEQVALLIGERKHGLWRYQENGFIRVYREKGSKEGIMVEEKRAAIDMGGCTGEAKTDEDRRLLAIIKKCYLQLKVGEFEYAFGDEEQKDNKWLNWIDLPMYHPFFEKRYEDHVPVDLSIYYCQVSYSDNMDFNIYKDHRSVINFSESNRNRVAERGITHNDTDYVDS